MKQREVTDFAKGGNLIASLCKIRYFSHRNFGIFLFEIKILLFEFLEYLPYYSLLSALVIIITLLDCNTTMNNLFWHIFVVILEVPLLHDWLSFKVPWLMWELSSICHILHKQETSTLHLCLLIPNACRHFIQTFCFNNVDHSAMVCVIPWTLAPMTTLQAPAPKFRKSQNQYLMCSSYFNHRSTSQHHWADTLLKFYEC